MNLLSKAQPTGVKMSLASSAAVASVEPVEIDLDAILQERSPIAIERGQGRGIVIPGGGIYLRSSWVTIRMIRHFGCDLPIELWLLPWESVKENEQRLLAFFDVTVRTAEPGYCVNESTIGFGGLSIWLPGWQLKVQSVLQSAFNEVMFLDADCYPVDARWLKSLTTGPTFLGDVAESDHLLTESSCRAFRQQRQTPIDSGCFYVDKSISNWCHVLAVLNGPDYVRKTYALLHGDKDSWWISHALTGSPFRVIGRGSVIGDMAGIYHAIGVVHRTGNKLTTGSPANTPQKATFAGPCEDLVQQFLRSWPPLAMRSARDWEMVQSVIELDEYHLRAMPALRTVIDCGGHVGSFSAAVQALFPACRVLAFEPSPDNAALFRENAPAAELHVTALGLDPGEVQLWAVPGDTAFSTSDRIGGSVASGESATVSRLSSYLVDIPSVDLMKVDIEGDEYAVFEDLRNSGQLEKIRRIVGEWHRFECVGELLRLLRPTHHVTVCTHPWDHGYFEAVRVQ